jgi:alpha-glucosidase
MRALAIVAVLAACSDPPPVEVGHGRLTALVYPDPARITLVLDGNEVWTTQSFAQVGTFSGSIEMQFGSFKFTENKANESTQTISELAAIEPTDTGATFELRASDRKLGTGTLTLDDTGHARIELTVDHADKFSLGAACAKTEHLVGLGGQSFDVDHQGEVVPLWVQEDGIGKFADPDDNYMGVWFLTGRKHSTHTPMPMLLSSAGYGVIVDTNARAVFDLGGTKPGTCRFEAWEPHLDVHVFVGGTRESLTGMLGWVGKPAPAPELVFAPWIDALFGSTNVRRVAQKLRDNGIASSVIWSEDWRGGMFGTTGYALQEDWRVDRGLYPDFEQVATDLHAQGFAWHTYNNTFLDETADVHDEAVGSGYAIKDASGNAYSFTGVKFNQSTMLDLTNPAAVAWAKSVMLDAVTLGSDGWMADFAEWLPTDAVLASGEDAKLVHNRYTVDWARMNREMFANAPANRPPPIYFMRSAWLHSQPEVMVMWAGDQQTDWTEGDGFPSVIPIGLGLGLTGFPYFGHDIGGYMSQGTVSTSEELFYRWTTLGALSPVMRTHHGRNVDTNVQWEHDAGTIAHFRRWTRFHMQLVPYLMGIDDGMPLFRMIAIDYPDEDWAWTTIDEYLLGDRILVAPIVTEATTSRTVKLPAGQWVPLFGGAPVEGEITATADRTEIPAYVPAGTLLVLYPDGVETVLGGTTASREVWLYQGAAANPAHQALAGYTWSGTYTATATFNGAPVTISNGSVTVDGSGTLQFAGGGALIIPTGATTTIVRLR